MSEWLKPFSLAPFPLRDGSAVTTLLPIFYYQNYYYYYHPSRFNARTPLALNMKKTTSYPMTIFILDMDLWGGVLFWECIIVWVIII